MNRKHLLFGAVFLVSNIVWGQTLKVKDKISLQPIPFAVVTSYSATGETKTALTDDKGMADVSIQKSDSIRVSATGYQAVFISKIHTSDSLRINSTGNPTLVVKINYEAIMDLEIFLAESSHMFNEVVVSANRFEENQRDIAQPVEVISSRDIAFSNANTAADVISNTGNVLVQKSQQGGGSPIIRGFETNKVLLVVDGVRMNNAIYRGGHLQNIITLDNAIMDRVEILYGPGSVMYGSDALGGVMHFVTKNPILSSTSTLAAHGNAFARYSSAAEEKTFHADLSLGGRKLGSLTSFTYSDFGDLTQGSERDDKYPDFGKRPFYAVRENGEDVQVANDDPNIQIGSGYTQYDFLQKFVYMQNDDVSHQLNVQYSTSTDVPRYDRLTETANGTLRFGDWYYGPQDRFMAMYALRLENKVGLFNRGRITAAFQKIEESRHDRRFGREFINHRIEQVDVFTLNADFAKDVGKNEWRYGVEGTTNHVDSKATQESVLNGDVKPQNTRYPDGGSDVSSAALYISDYYHLSDQFVLNAGARFSYNNLKSVFNDTTFFPFPYNDVTQSHATVSGSLGMVWNGHAGWRVSLLGATGYRAPNVDDLAKVFESVPGNVVVPNPELGPENTYSVDLGLSKTSAGRYSVGADVFYTSIKNAITTRPGTFNGASQIEYEGQLSNVTMNVNAISAYIYGASAYLSVDLTDAISLYSTINYTYGRINTDTTDYPLDHIPPLFGKTSVSYKVKKFKAEAYAMYSGWKKLEDYNLFGEDNYAFATVDGMPAWMTLNLKASYQAAKNVMVQAGVENLLDRNYRVFASNISAPGRNLIVAVRGSF